MTALSILYDNHAAEDLRPGWGFSAYIRTEGAIVMFDTGADKLVLDNNVRELGCNLDIVTALVLSHEHCDHMGAVSTVLHKGLDMYVPAAFAKRFDGRRKAGIGLTAVKKPVERSFPVCGRSVNSAARSPSRPFWWMAEKAPC